MKSFLPESDVREQRLDEIRQEAALRGNKAALQNPATGPGDFRSSGPGYYGRPVLKRPQWTIEVPLYFFTGGVAGAAALIAAVGQLSSADEKLIRQSRWLAAIGGAISPALLISDLGMPSRFLNMLRVFKVQSPMSVGSWTLVAFSSSAAASAVFGEFERRRKNRGIRLLRDSGQVISALTGMILATYTGVLIGATAIPAWNENVGSLPIHFAASGMSAAASILELAGNPSKALNRIAMGAAALETMMGLRLELDRTTQTQALRAGRSGFPMRAAGALSGPIPLALRLLALSRNSNSQNLRRSAAVCSVLGSLLTRWAWIEAGKKSAADPRVPLQIAPQILS